MKNAVCLVVCLVAPAPAHAANAGFGNAPFGNGKHSGFVEISVPIAAPGLAVTELVSAVEKAFQNNHYDLALKTQTVENMTNVFGSRKTFGKYVSAAKETVKVSSKVEKTGTDYNLLVSATLDYVPVEGVDPAPLSSQQSGLLKMDTHLLADYMNLEILKAAYGDHNPSRFGASKADVQRAVQTALEKQLYPVRSPLFGASGDFASNSKVQAHRLVPSSKEESIVIRGHVYFVDSASYLFVKATGTYRKAKGSAESIVWPADLNEQLELLASSVKKDTENLLKIASVP